MGGETNVSAEGRHVQGAQGYEEGGHGSHCISSCKNFHHCAVKKKEKRQYNEFFISKIKFIQILEFSDHVLLHFL